MSNERTEGDNGAVRVGLSRRRFLNRSGVVAAATGFGLAGCVSERRVDEPEGLPPEPDVFCATGFFNPHEALTVEALAARIIPGTPDDPGAREAGVVNYIDCLMATAQGIAEPMYLQPPFPAPEPEDLAPLQDVYEDLPPLVRGGEPTPPSFPSPGGQSGSIVQQQRDNSVESSSYGVIPLPRSQFDRYGYQSLLPPSELFRRGLAALDVHTTEAFGSDFVSLSDTDQDAVVQQLADDQSDAFDVPSAQGFFELVRRHTIEGMFSDPIYGGNRDMVGWRLVGYPGAQRAYTPDDVRDPHFRRAPQSLADLHRFNSGRADRPEAVTPVAGSDQHGHQGH